MPEPLIFQEIDANGRFQACLQAVVSHCRDASFEVGMLDLLHVTRCCEQGIPVPLHNQAYYYQLFKQLFHLDQNAFHQMDPLIESTNIYRNIRTTAHPGALLDNVMIVCADLAKQAEQNYR